jgi:RND family efflux transporter MFP subunit
MKKIKNLSEVTNLIHMLIVFQFIINELKFNYMKYFNKRNSSKKILPFLFHLLISNVFLNSCTYSGGQERIIQEKINMTSQNVDKQIVSVFPLHNNVFKKEVITNGKLLALNKADLMFRTSENLVEIYVKNGDRVVKGDSIAKLDNFTLTNIYKQSILQFDKAEVDLQDIIMSLGFNANNIDLMSDKIMKTARSRSGIDKAQSDLEIAEYNLKAAVLTSPFPGIVANLFLKENNFYNQGVKFCTIIDDSKFEAEFPVLESELSFVKIGQTVRIIPYSLNGITVEAKIIKLNPLVDQNGMVKVSAICKNNDNKLFEGMNVKIIIEEDVPNQLIIPKQALVIRGDKQVVFTYAGGKAKWVYVKTGLENTSSFSIIEGLHEGDSVIYEGNSNLVHDAAVSLK